MHNYVEQAHHEPQQWFIVEAMGVNHKVKSVTIFEDDDGAALAK